MHWMTSDIGILDVNIEIEEHEIDKALDLMLRVESLFYEIENLKDMLDEAMLLIEEKRNEQAKTM